jgi:hypothetical protein
MFSKSKIRISLSPLTPIISTFTIYPHTHAHLDLIVWLVSLVKLFDFTIYVLHVCMSCLHTYELHISLSCRVRKRGGITLLLPWWGSTNTTYMRDLRESYKGISEFYFRNLQKLWNNSWMKSLRHSAWLDRSVFQLLKTQVKATNPMVKGNMNKFKSRNSLLESGGEFLFERMCTFEAWKHCSNSWSIVEFSFAKVLAKVKLGWVVDGS